MRRTIFILMLIVSGCSEDTTNDLREDDSGRVNDADGMTQDTNTSSGDMPAVDASGTEIPAPEGPSSLELGVRICPWETYCSDSTVPSIASCLEHYADERFAVFYFREQQRSVALALADCLSEVEDCAGYRACRDVGTGCTESSCDGDVLNLCDREGRLITQDCSASGLECLETNEFDWPVLCGVPGASCTERTRCEGDVQLWCPNEGQQVPFAYDCSQYGLVCDQGACVKGRAEMCPSGGGCSDHQLLECLNGVSVPIECRDLHPDFTCVDRRTGEPFLDPLGDPQCLMPEQQLECQAEFTRDIECEGDIAVTCVKNREFRMDCSSLGGTCVEQDLDFIGRLVACRPLE